MSTPRSPKTLREIASSFFSFGSPRLLGAQVVAALLVRPFLGPPGLGDVIAAAGVMAYWPIQEWALHKWLLHAPPLRIGRFSFQLAATKTHGYHHEHPLEPKATLLPTWTIAVLVPIHVAAWALLAPSASVACTGIVCLGAAALSYEWIHFFSHTAYKPTTAWFREVKRRHLAHHFRDSARYFAFAVPAVDDWFGTGDRPTDHATDETTHAPH
jgi:hypothetical protein